MTKKAAYPPLNWGVNRIEVSDLKERPMMVLLSLAALCALAAAQDENITDANGWLNEGYRLAANGSYEQALQAYENATELDPGNEMAWINRGNILTRMNRTDEAGDAYRNALHIIDEMIVADPQNATLWTSSGLLLFNVGDYEQSVMAFDNATSIDPEYEMAWKMKGVILTSELSRNEEANAALDRALEINPSDPLTWMAKGSALAALDRQDEAEAAYEKAKELGYDPGDGV